jgi:hypothetical protein
VKLKYFIFKCVLFTRKQRRYTLIVCSSKNLNQCLLVESYLRKIPTYYVTAGHHSLILKDEKSMFE